MSRRKARKATINQTCYICVQPCTDSKDHIVPTGFFPAPRPSSLVTLPAHFSCHNRLSEDYARAVLAGTSETPVARRIMEDVRRSLIDRKRVYPLLQKMVRGLYHHHTKQFIPPAAVFAWGLNERPVGSLETVFSQSVVGLSYPAVFECRYRVIADNDGELSLWWLRFYEGWIFRCATDTVESAFTV